VLVQEDPSIVVPSVLSAIVGFIQVPADLSNLAAVQACNVALSIASDVARQCHEDGVCMLATLDVDARTAFLNAIAVVIDSTQSLNHGTPSPLVVATRTLLHSRALIALATVVELSDDPATLDAALTATERTLSACLDDNRSRFINVAGATAARALSRIISGSLYASQHAGTRITTQHVTAAAMCTDTAYGAFCAATFTRNAIALVSYHSCLRPLWDAPAQPLPRITEALLAHNATATLCNTSTALLTTIIEEHGTHPSESGCRVVQQLCGLLVTVAASSEGPPLLRTGVECAAQVILTAQASGGCSCSPHVGELVHFVDACARTGPFDDALTRRVASCVGACATVNFAAALPGESPKSLVHAASCLVRDSVQTSTTAFNNSCMAYGSALIALGLHAGPVGLADDFLTYVLHVGNYFVRQATDFALPGCVLPIAVMVAAEPERTAEALSNACSLQQQDPREALRTRHAITSVFSLWFAVAPNADTRVQSYTLSAWLQWTYAALNGSPAAQFVLAELGPDAQSQPALSRACARFTVLKSLHPKQTAKDLSTPGNVLRECPVVTVAEGIALSAMVLREAASFHVTQLASFASHAAFDQLNLSRWANTPCGLLMPGDVAAGMLTGGGVIIVPYLAEQLLGLMSANMDGLLSRVEDLRGSEVEPKRRVT
jgi:hypothetical protein